MTIYRDVSDRDIIVVRSCESDRDMINARVVLPFSAHLITS